jgi:hypothetical protein
VGGKMVEYLIYSHNQTHGKTAEDIIKSQFPGASDHKRSPLNDWDIERKFDRECKLATSIKTSIDPSAINLADARKIWSIIEPYRLLIWRYIQKNVTMIEYYAIEEYLISLKEHKKLLGDISLQEVENYHDSIYYDKFSEFETAECREFAQRYKLDHGFKERALITLNPKIQSNQRRIQCSIRNHQLQDVVKHYTLYDDFYKSMPVNQIAKKPPRKTKNSKE